MVELDDVMMKIQLTTFNCIKKKDLKKIEEVLKLEESEKSEDEDPIQII